MARQDIQARVRGAAEQPLAEQQYVRPVDVLLDLEQVVQGNLGKVSKAMAELRGWATAQGLVPSETAYLARTRDRSKPPELVVVDAVKPWTCAECREEFGGGILLMDSSGPRCLDCADLGYLEFLPAGNAALTRRAKKASRTTAVVVRWTRARKRYERQGILVEPAAGLTNRCGADPDPQPSRRDRGRPRL